MTIDILQALSQQKIDAYAHQSRIICDDGLDSIHDEVFKCTMYKLGFDKEEADEWMKEPINLRHKFIAQWKSIHDTI